MSITPGVFAKARAEIIALFGWNADSLSPDQTLRIDCAVALRLALDDLQGRIVRGESADVSRMLTASEALARLLPPTVLATPPAEQHGDPRQAMWEIYKTMRERGEIGLKALAPDEGPLQTKINEQAAEIERLKALIPPSGTSCMTGSTAIDPPTCDIVPPSELGEAYVGMKRGADDPPPMLPPIEGKAVKVSPTNPPNPPAARAARPSRPQTWDDTAGGKAWQAWHDAGGSVGGDPWANNNR
jgi:hypothetical protein